MPDLFYINDYGQYILEDGVVYERVGQIEGSVNDISPDMNSALPITYNNADAQGKLSYTIPERLISRYIPSNYQTVSMPANDTWYTVFTATEAGTCRVWVGGEPVTVRVNGGANLVTNFGVGSEVDAFPVNVLPGHVVEIQYDVNNSRTGYCTFLPFVYNPA